MNRLDCPVSPDGTITRNLFDVRDESTATWIGNGTLDETLWCLMDYFDPMAILNSAGAGQERYTYSAFGVPLILAPDYSTRSSSAFDWDFLFHGQFTDEETGYQNYGYRFYVPALGRWPNRDLIEEESGGNLYIFVRNNPIFLVDYLGLIDLVIGWTCSVRFSAPCVCSDDPAVECGNVTGDSSKANANRRKAIQDAQEDAINKLANSACDKFSDDACNCPDATCDLEGRGGQVRPKRLGPFCQPIIRNIPDGPAIPNLG